MKFSPFKPAATALVTSGDELSGLSIMKEIPLNHVFEQDCGIIPLDYTQSPKYGGIDVNCTCAGNR